jgi:hypothetical protein
MEGKENQGKVAPALEEGNAEVTTETKRPRSIFEGFKGGVGPVGGIGTRALVACVNSTPRDPAHAGAIQRVIPTGGNGGQPSFSASQINHQILHSLYKFKEGAPLGEYLRRKVPTLRGKHTFYEVLMMLKIIIQDNLLYDENNPSVIVGDPALEATLGKKEVYVGEDRDIIYR